jgi:putative peptidoglycan lipid II flippase
MKSSSVTRSASVVSLGVMGSRVMGLVREVVLAALFGASREFDAFLMAFRIPNLLRDLFAEGALSAAFVSTFTQKFARDGEKSAWRLANLVTNALLLIVGAVVLLGIFATPWIVNAIAPGFREIAGKTELTVTLTRIMFPFLLLISLAALAMGVLNSRQKFGIPANASTMFNIAAIAFGVPLGYFLDPNFGPRALYGVAIGTLIGGAAQWLFQVPSLFKVGYRYEPALDWRDDDFRNVVRLVGPATLGIAAVQINIFVDNFFASFFGNGAVSWLNCAFRLMQFPIGVFGVAVGVATLPHVSAHVARGDVDKFRETLGRSVRLVLFLCIPAACGLAILAKPIVALIYQHGRFDASATAETALILQMFAVGLVGYAAIKVVAPAFYAFGDAKTPARVAMASIFVNGFLDWLFAMRWKMGPSGLALSTSAVALTNFAWLLVLMRRKIGKLDGQKLAQSAIRIGGASAVMTMAVIFVADFLAQTFGNVSIAARAAVVFGAIGAGLLAFGASCKLLRVEELGELMAVLRFGERKEKLP